MTLWDADGNEYLDFLAGISVCNTGHCHPHVVAAIEAQTRTLMHVSNLYSTRPMVELAERLAASSLGGRVLFANSGAEANEAALKLVRKARPRGEIVVLHGGFHGRTYGALSATFQESKQAPFAPLVPGFVPVPRDVAALDAAVGEQTAAVLLEPIQGETGVNVLSEELLAAARAACDRSGAALVFDEVQTGMGRTGTLWAYEATGVVPDAITIAKALAGGLPAGALITGERLAGVFAPGDHGSTFAGGPVIAAAAHAALDVLDDPVLLERVRELGLAAGRVAARAARRAGGARPRADDRRRHRSLRARRRQPRAARAAARDQRDRPADAALPAAADRRALPRRRRAGAARAAAVVVWRP